MGETTNGSQESASIISPEAVTDEILRVASLGKVDVWIRVDEPGCQGALSEAHLEIFIGFVGSGNPRY